jgi:hypothetical protein
MTVSLLYTNGMYSMLYIEKLKCQPLPPPPNLQSVNLYKDLSHVSK